MPKLLLGLMLAGAALSVLPAHAEDAPAQASTAEDKSWAQKHLKASYLFWAQNMHTEALSGNRDGTGTNLEFDHFLAVGARLNKEMSFTTSFWAAQIVDEDDTTKQFQPGDIYMTLSHNKLYHNDPLAINLDGYLRFYLPTSANTINALNKGTIRDAGHGKVRALLNPTKSFLDGKLTVAGLVYMNFLFNSMSPQERYDRATRQQALDGETVPKSIREDMQFVFDPSVVYSVSPKVDVYIEWATGVLRHTTSGVVNGKAVEAKWSSINHPSDGMYLSPGIYWNPTKKISVNPYLSYQLSAVHDTAVNSVKRRVGLLNADIGVQLQYTFL